tara:strand:- start:582 stop:1310 length:729 start_codon:yes stop_codon:yes gene_type:complete
MPLPKVNAPTFELTLLSNNKTVKFRPFLVKEEKSLLIALENGNDKDVIATVKDVLKSCILTRGIKIDELPSFDLEYLFLNIRGKSVGETIDLIVTCQDDGVTTVPLQIKMSDIKLVEDENHCDTIKLDDNLLMKLKYPSYQTFIDNNFIVNDVKDTDRIDKAFDAVVDSIDQIYTDEEMWAASDCTKKELLKFIEQLNSKQFSEIENFFTTMPKLQYKTKVVNPNTNKESEVIIEGLANFFA